jgi:hypothetical protein
MKRIIKVIAISLIAIIVTVTYLYFFSYANIQLVYGDRFGKNYTLEMDKSIYYRSLMEQQKNTIGIMLKKDKVKVQF